MSLGAGSLMKRPTTLYLQVDREPAESEKPLCERTVRVADAQRSILAAHVHRQADITDLQLVGLRSVVVLEIHRPLQRFAIQFYSVGHGRLEAHGCIVPHERSKRRGHRRGEHDVVRARTASGVGPGPEVVETGDGHPVTAVVALVLGPPLLDCRHR